jgi:type I restriction enzyme S subunit
VTSVAFPTKRIEDFCRTGSGGTPSRSKPEYFDGGAIPWVKSGELKTRFVSSTEESITDAAVEQSAVKLVPKGALLIAMYGATVGEVSELAMDATTNQAICHIVPDPKLCDRGYLYQYLSAIKPELLDRRVGGGQPNISQAIIKSLSVPLPPLPEQRRIAAILDKADALRAKRREAIAKLDQLLQSVFLEMFGDPVTNPKGWPMTKLAELGEWSSGGTPPRLNAANFEGDIPWYSSGELNSVYVGKSDECISPSAIKNSAAKIMRPGSLMIGMYDTAAFKSSITTVPAACNQAIAFSYLDEEKCEPIYVYQALQLGKEHFKRMQRGVRQKNLNLSLIRDTQIAHPPLAEQREFSSRFRAIHNQIESHMKFDLMTNGLFASLQQQAFIGAI